jgi:hypothetical protein
MKTIDAIITVAKFSSEKKSPAVAGDKWSFAGGYIFR